MTPDSLDTDELFELAAELSYFHADFLKKDDDEKNRVWNEVQTHCQKNGIPFDVFSVWLLNRVALINTARSKALLGRIKAKEKKGEFDSNNQNGNSCEPEYAEVRAWIKDLPAKYKYSPNNDELYDLVAELGYFNANIVKNSYQERSRVWGDVHSWCKKKQIRFDVFTAWLMNCLTSKKPTSKALRKIIKTNREAKTDNAYTYTRHGYSDTYYSLKFKVMIEKENEDIIEENPAIDPQLYPECNNYNDDWDGPKY
jgi:hypothetical protein